MPLSQRPCLHVHGCRQRMVSARLRQGEHTEHPYAAVQLAHAPLLHAMGSPVASAALGALALIGPGRKILVDGILSLVRCAASLQPDSIPWGLLSDTGFQTGGLIGQSLDPHGDGPWTTFNPVTTVILHGRPSDENHCQSCRGHPDMNSLVGFGAATSFAAGAAAMLVRSGGAAMPRISRKDLLARATNVATGLWLYSVACSEDTEAHAHASQAYLTTLHPKLPLHENHSKLDVRCIPHHFKCGKRSRASGWSRPSWRSR